MGEFDDIEAKAKGEAGKLEAEGKTKAEQVAKKEAGEYEQKGKDFAEEEAKDVESKF
jgi:hypothetical protein